MSGFGISAVCRACYIQYTDGTTEKSNAYLKSPSISMCLKKRLTERTNLKAPCKENTISSKILFPLTILMIYILLHSLHRVPPKSVEIA